MSKAMQRLLRGAAATAVLVSGSALAATAPNGETYVDQPLFDDFNGTAVNTVTWQVATWAEHGGQTGYDRCFVQDGMLHMQFINSSTDGFLSSAIQTRREYYFGKWEFRAKPTDVYGVLNSFYTIDWDNTAVSGSSSDGTKEEIDIEFLTKAFTGTDGRVHYALHKSGATSYQTNPDVLLGFDPSDTFHVYGFNITPEKIEWLADSTVMRTYEYASNPITITAPYQLKLNHWSAVSWISGPPAADVVCDYLIDWIKFTPYAASAVNDGGPRIPDIVTRYVAGDELVLMLARPVPLAFRLYDAAGNAVLCTEKADAAAGVHRFSLSGPGSGMYLYTLTTDGGMVTGKVFIK